jgi:hypothetical protein
MADKLVGAMTRIALILWAAESNQEERDDPRAEISGSTVRRAIEIAKYFLRHNEYVLTNLLTAKPGQDAAETLWKWMDEQRAKGSTLFAIPHNGNASDGRMFELVKFDGKPIDAAYNKTRAENEPLYEITQIKGTSKPSVAVAERRVRRLRAMGLHALGGLPAAQHRRAASRAALLDGMSQAAPATRSSMASLATPTRTTLRPATRSSTSPASSPSRTMQRNA